MSERLTKALTNAQAMHQCPTRRECSRNTSCHVCRSSNTGCVMAASSTKPSSKRNASCSTADSPADTYPIKAKRKGRHAVPCRPPTWRRNHSGCRSVTPFIPGARLGINAARGCTKSSVRSAAAPRECRRANSGPRARRAAADSKSPASRVFRREGSLEGKRPKRNEE